MFDIDLKPPFDKLLMVRRAHDGPKVGLRFDVYDDVDFLVRLQQ